MFKIFLTTIIFTLVSATLEGTLGGPNAPATWYAMMTIMGTIGSVITFFCALGIAVYKKIF